MDFALFGTVYIAVVFAEMLGDKLLFGTSALVARFGARSVVAGALPALMVKSLAAVVLGGVIAGLPTRVIAIASCFAFAFAAYSIWRESGETTDVAHAQTSTRGFRLRGALAAFTAIFFAEWADPGQLATVALAASSQSPGTVWLAASAAMATKLLVALSLGSVVQRVAQPRLIRWAGFSLSAVLAITAVLERE